MSRAQPIGKMPQPARLEQDDSDTHGVHQLESIASDERVSSYRKPPQRPEHAAAAPLWGPHEDESAAIGKENANEMIATRE